MDYIGHGIASCAVAFVCAVAIKYNYPITAVVIGFFGFISIWDGVNR